MKIESGKREDVERKASRLIAEKIQDILEEKDKVVMALPGGSSVKGVFELLKKEDIDWSKVIIFMVDERLLPLCDENSNYRLVKNELLDDLFNQGVIETDNVYPFVYTGDALKDCAEYWADLKSVGGKFDIVLLSSGEDGHIAGLFPELSVNEESSGFFPFYDSPKPPRDRMTASRDLIEKSSVAILLFFGTGKKDALEMFKHPELKANKCPAKIVKSINHHVFTDIE